MGRAKRAEKKNFNFKIWLPIICIIIVGVTFYMIHDMNTKIKQNNISNTNTINSEKQNAIENTTIENEVENEIVNEITNEAVENTVENTAVVDKKQTTEIVNKVINESSAPAQPAVTDQKEKAIELVKKQWGNDDSVDYMFDYINENGEYVIAVKDRNTATVKCYFRVNLETETVDLD